MKKLWLILVLPAVLATLCACDSPQQWAEKCEAAVSDAAARQIEAEKIMAGYTDETPVYFVDKLVEARIRAEYITKWGSITVGDMKKLTTFEYIGDYAERCDYTNLVYTLYDLRYCVNLETLRVNSPGISSIEPLRGLPNLKSVDLQCYYLSDLSPLAGKEFLEDVSISSSAVIDASPVLALPSLRKFNGNGTVITDISALRGTNGLTAFCCGSKLNDYTPLLGHKGMESISLTGITDQDFVSIMDNLKNLKYVRISDSAIEDKSLKMLQGLDINGLSLYNCGIKDISALSALNTVQDLRLHDNDIEDISPLAGLTQLSYFLDLDGNDIKDLAPLKNLTNLKALCISTNDREVLDELNKNGCEIERWLPFLDD